MADELLFTGTTGQSGLNIILSTRAKTYWDGTDATQATYATAVTSGKLTVAEHQASGVYYATAPATLVSGGYVALVLNSSNVKITSFNWDWNGTAEITQQNPTDLVVTGSNISIT
jgi:hypothetical protein